eukprot:140823_1
MLDIELIDNNQRNKNRHRKQDSFSIKLTPAYNYAANIDTMNGNEIILNPSKLSIPPSPSRSKSRSYSRSKSHSKSRSKNKSPNTILTDKDGIDILEPLNNINDERKQRTISMDQGTDNSADKDAYTLFMGNQTFDKEQDEKQINNDNKANLNNLTDHVESDHRIELQTTED